jgi:hypothetical protein
MHKLKLSGSLEANLKIIKKNVYFFRHTILQYAVLNLLLQNLNYLSMQ